MSTQNTSNNAVSPYEVVTEPILPHRMSCYQCILQDDAQIICGGHPEWHCSSVAKFRIAHRISGRVLTNAELIQEYEEYKKEYEHITLRGHSSTLPVPPLKL